MIQYLFDNPATVAAILSFFATAFAAWATWKGPQSAAILAETMRLNSEKDHERRRMKLNVFATLMQERATIYSVESVRMLNSIDFVFSESPTVREAWADLYTIFQGDIHPQLREDKVRVLLREMAADLGLSSTLKVDDLGRIYYPNALAQEAELRRLQQEQALLQIRSANGPVASQEIAKKFPPKP